jgi:pimeloyl-ACP methyl ester carboxylesterase
MPDTTFRRLSTPARDRPNPWRRLARILLALLGLALLALVALAVVPPPTGGLASHPNPAADYSEATRRVAALQVEETAGFNPLCKAQLLTHGQKTARAIAFIHGYTNCPHQFLPLGQQFYDLGYNVLLVPMPHHGLADLMTNDMSKLTAEEMAAYADQLVDISHGLGDRVTVAGLSQGGVVAGWAAQTRPDLDQAVLIAPGFGLKLIPTPLTVLAANVVLLAPESYQWWDPLHDPKSPPPTLSPTGVQGYPRYSLHGLAQQLRLGFATEALARRTAPAAKSILLVTNANDLAVENSVADQVAADWRAHGGNVTIYDFSANLNLYHDLISPEQSLQRIDIVYPKLIELINQ